jgi:hypothetical protein
MYQIVTSYKTSALRKKHRARSVGYLWAGLGQHVVQRISTSGARNKKVAETNDKCDKSFEGSACVSQTHFDLISTWPKATGYRLAIAIVRCSYASQHAYMHLIRGLYTETMALHLNSSDLFGLHCAGSWTQ